jgi:ABC-2 type transport system permease protein
MNAETNTERKVIAVPKLPSPLAASWLMAGLFFRITLGRKRVLWTGVALLLPLLMAVVRKMTSATAGSTLFVENALVLLQFFAVGLSLFFGVSAVRDEIEDRTIVYLFARPVPRWTIFGGKIAAVILVVASLLSALAGLSYVILVAPDGMTTLTAGLDGLARAILALAMACLVYTAAFSFLGVLIRKPMIPAIVLAFGWEVIVSNLPSVLPRYTCMYYLKSLMGLGPEGLGKQAPEVLASLLPTLDAAPVSRALTVLLCVAACMLLATLVLGNRKEHRV